MISAREVQAIAEASRTMEKLDKDIRQASSKGYRSTVFTDEDDMLGNLTVELNRLGYSVRKLNSFIRFSGYDYEIKW